MLVLSRKTGERIAIGDAVIVTVLRLSGGRVKLGITAPDDVSVLRTEVLSDENTGVHALRGSLSYVREPLPPLSRKVSPRNQIRPRLPR